MWFMAPKCAGDCARGLLRTVVTSAKLLVLQQAALPAGVSSVVAASSSPGDTEHYKVLKVPICF